MLLALIAAASVSVEITPTSVHIEAGQTATFTIVTRAVDGTPAPFELWQNWNAVTPSGQLWFTFPDKSASDIVNGPHQTTAGQTRTFTLRAPDDAHAGVYIFGIDVARDFQVVQHFTGANVYVENGLISACPEGYHQNPDYANSCLPDAFGCSSTRAGAGAFLALPLLALLVWKRNLRG